jgi:sugar lactone lactonase YvrE
MRFIGHNVSTHSVSIGKVLICNSSIKLRAICLPTLALALAGSLSTALAQTAPYVLPYAMSTFAGPSAGLSIGQACGAFISLDAVGDGCQAPYVSIGADPHDIRVDGQGNVYWFDNGSKEVIHKIAASNGLETVYAGSAVQTKVCSTGNGDKLGDGCIANDGAANSGKTTFYTGSLPKSRGLGIAANGDLFFADYNGDEDHEISASTGLMTRIAGTGTAGDTDGPAGSSQVNGTRGIGVNSSTGAVYIADTGNNLLREVLNGVVSTITAASGAAGSGSGGCVHSIANGPASAAQLCAPEDAQVDSNGNIYIADEGNDVVRAIYVGGTLPGIANPVVGNIYTVAGNGNQPPYTSSCYSSTPTTPPPVATAYAALTLTNGLSSNAPATSVPISIRKLSIDSRGNLYLSDSCNGVVWFVDAVTGNMRVLAGLYGQTQSTTPSASLLCSNPTDAFGDGCPGPQSSLDPSSDMGAAPDNQGNLYITDAEGGTVAISRLRKLLSGLDFPTAAAAASITQTIDIHFAPGDTPAASHPFVSSSTDFVVGAPTCTVGADTTDDCLVPVTFTPTKPGYDTATLAIASAKGGANSYLLTGTGTAATLVIDPGATTLLATPTLSSTAQGVALDGAGDAYIADTANNRILLYAAASGTTTVFAGTGSAGYTGDNGAASAASLSAPKAVALDTDGNLYIADSGNNVIRKVNAAGTISTYGGGATTVCSQSFDALGDGCPATQATFSNPSGLTADKDGVLYVSDTGNNVIRQIDVSGDVTAFAGGATGPCATASDTFGDGCSGSQSIFKSPAGLAYDNVGNAIVAADSADNVVRKISLPNTFSITGTGASALASNILINGVTLVAGNGQAGSSVDAGGSAILSQLNSPTAVAVDAAENVYIADTQNDAVRLVNASNGQISTIVGIGGSPGTGTVPGAATDAQLTNPQGVAVSTTGLLYVLDSGNARALVDNRSQAAKDFGRTNLGVSSPVQNFTETSIGTTAAQLPASPLFVATGDTSVFTLLPASGSTGCNTSSSGSTPLAVGASCIVQGQFNDAAGGNFSATYTETGAVSVGATPSITLTGVGAVLTATTSTVSQTAPTGSAQYGGSLTLTASITAASCNSAAPACFPTGTVRIVVDGTAGAPETLIGSGTSATGSQTISGLAVGPHTISCNYSGDSFYAASSCGNVALSVGQAATTSTNTAAPLAQQQFPMTNCSVILATGPTKGDSQCNATTLTATVVSNTTGSPTGTVTFYANGTAIGSQPLNSTTGVASLTLYTIYDTNRSVIFDDTLPAGSYSLTCTYSGATNFAASTCAAFKFTVTASPAAFSLTPRGCAAVALQESGTTITGEGVGCSTGVELFNGAAPVVATAQGSTTDATVFINGTNTVAGTLTFSCSGLPAGSICTFSPTSVTAIPSTGAVAPLFTDVTLWTDLQPGTVPTKTSMNAAPSLGHTGNTTRLAFLLGWPFTLLGFAGLIRFRRRSGHIGALTLTALAMLLAGSSLTLSGCSGGPGAYKPNLTPAGTYPIIVTVTGDGITQSTIIDFTVAAPGITGQE